MPSGACPSYLLTFEIVRELVPGASKIALLVDPDNSTRRLLIADGYPAQPEIWAWCCPSSRRPRPSKSTLPSLRPPPSTPMRSRFFWRSSDRYYPRLPNCRPAANIVCPRLSSTVEFDRWLFLPQQRFDEATLTSASRRRSDVRQRAKRQR
jgi:hypothetical protein